MLQVLWGFIFLLFDINVSSYSIDILPDFIGWILAIYGLSKLSNLTGMFICVRISGIFMILTSLLQFVISFMGSDNFIYTYLSKLFSIENADAAYLLSNIFWGLKLIALTLVIIALFNIRNRLGDIKRVKILRTVWFAILTIEIATFLFNNFIMTYFPNSVRNAIMQILVVGVIFLKIWLIFSAYKINKAVSSLNDGTV